MFSRQGHVKSSPSAQSTSLSLQQQFTPGFRVAVGSAAASVGGAYFEGRLPADVHKQHAVSLQHVLKHLLAGKSADSRPEREDTHSPNL